jgi:hypothetical protein
LYVESDAWRSQPRERSFTRRSAQHKRIFLDSVEFFHGGCPDGNVDAAVLLLPVPLIFRRLKPMFLINSV